MTKKWNDKKMEDGDAFSDNAFADCLFFCPPFFCHQILFSDSALLTDLTVCSKGRNPREETILAPLKGWLESLTYLAI
jgi:hypothetical protein